MLGNVIKSPLSYPSTFNFTYLGGTISDVSSRFYFQSGTTYWRDIKFMGTTKGTGVFHFRGPQHVFENLYVT